MPSRKFFLTTAAALPLLAAAPSAPVPPMPASPKPSPAPKPASRLASEFALRMRGFDPNLTDKDLDAIARGIDGNLEVGAQINPKGKALRNWDEPVTIFAVPE